MQIADGKKKLKTVSVIKILSPAPVLSLVTRTSPIYQSGYEKNCVCVSVCFDAPITITCHNGAERLPVYLLINAASCQTHTHTHLYSYPLSFAPCRHSNTLSLKHTHTFTETPAVKNVVMWIAFVCVFPLSNRLSGCQAETFWQARLEETQRRHGDQREIKLHNKCPFTLQSLQLTFTSSQLMFNTRDLDRFNAY